MNMNVYTNECFYKSGKKATKIIFVTNMRFSFGVHLSNATRKIQCQKYIGEFKYSNINSGKASLTGLKEVINNWEKFSNNEKQYLYEASKMLTACFYKHVNIYAGFNPQEKFFILSCIKEYEKVIKELYYHCLLSYDNLHDYCYIYNENINQKKIINHEIKENNRKSINMFKIINANNLENLFEGNFYPIIDIKDGYYTIKDDNGNNCIIRANRGKEIQVFTEYPN